MTAFDLRSVSLFEKLPDADLERLSASLTECVLDKGDTLFDEGDVGDKAYIITSGEIEILKAAADRATVEFFETRRHIGGKRDVAVARAVVSQVGRYDQERACPLQWCEGGRGLPAALWR